MKHRFVRALAATTLATLSTFVAASGCASATQRRTDAGIELLDQGDLDGAETRFREALADDPENPMAAYRLGQVYEKRGDDYRARSWYRRAATHAKDYQVIEKGDDVSLSVWALRDLDRVSRRIEATAEQPGGAPQPSE